MATQETEGGTQIDDVAFMDLVREYPTLYDRSWKDFKDVTKKANCWKGISAQCGEPIKGKSGSGVSDVQVEQKYEHLRWLKTFILSRNRSGNFKASANEALFSSCSSGTSTPVPVSSTPKTSFKDFLNRKGEENISEDGIREEEYALEGDELSSQRSPAESQVEVAPDDASMQGEVDNLKVQSATAMASSHTEGVSDKKAAKAQCKWTKKESRKRKLEHIDCELGMAMTNLADSIRVQESAQTTKQPMIDPTDDDYLYSMSLANRLKMLDNRKKAIVRSSIEKIFLDIELGQHMYQTNYQSIFPANTTPDFQSNNVAGQYTWQQPQASFQNMINRE
eukprot:gene14937-16477_t